MHEGRLLENKKNIIFVELNTYALVFREKPIAIDYSTKQQQQQQKTTTKVKTKTEIMKKVNFTNKNFSEIKCLVTNLKYLSSICLVSRSRERTIGKRSMKHQIKSMSS